MEAIEFWCYELTPLGTLNAQTEPGAVCQGALLCHNGGYGCVHPWPSLGDASLEDQLACLAKGGPTNLTERALQCCRVDGIARREGRSLFSGLKIPPSHATIPWALESDAFEASVRVASASGCSLIKIKSGTNTELTIEKMRRVVELWTGIDGPQFRIDFNESLESGSFLRFSKSIRAYGMVVDFVEDPVPYDPPTWAALAEESGLTLALDRQDRQGNDRSSHQVRVWKPATAPAPSFEELGGARLVATSSMDHAIGQLFAAYEAARYGGELEVCGLLTHHLFEADPFFELLTAEGAQLVPPGGPGLGYGDLLKSLPWMSLT